MKDEGISFGFSDFMKEISERKQQIKLRRQVVEYLLLNLFFNHFI